jgi:hypothetical protein
VHTRPQLRQGLELAWFPSTLYEPGSCNKAILPRQVTGLSLAWTRYTSRALAKENRGLPMLKIARQGLRWVPFDE